MQIVEDFEITPVLGVGTVEMLRTAKAGTATAKQSTALTKLRSAIVFLSIAAAIDELAVDVTEKGLYFEETESSAANDVKLTALQGAKLDRIASKAKINGHKYLRTLQDFMELYPDDFSEYKTFIEEQEDYELDNEKILFIGRF